MVKLALGILPLLLPPKCSVHRMVGMANPGTKVSAYLDRLGDSSAIGRLSA